jgi:tetratricopeptide (TPR) repeat protein
MILLFLLINIEARIDSLEDSFARSRTIETLLALNECYLMTDQYQKSMTLLGQNERHFRNDLDGSRIKFELGNVFMYAGEIAKAHETYLGLMGRYPQLDIANDAAERLYLIETVRDDTVQMKRLINVVRLYEIGQYDAAVDSARVLLRSPVGAYAYYYLALAYRGKGDLTLTMAALDELNSRYPEHKIYEAVFLQASVHLILGELKNAEELLEDLIVREPNTIYAYRARQKLEKIEKMGSNLDN